MTNASYHQLVVFESEMEEALASVKRILDRKRCSSSLLANNQSLEYATTFQLADQWTNMGIVVLLQVLQELGMSREFLQTCLQPPPPPPPPPSSSSSSSSSTTLRFCWKESCTFEKEKVHEEETSLRQQETKQEAKQKANKDSTTVKSSMMESIVSRTIQEHYTIGIEWELSVHSASRTDTNHHHVLQSHKSSGEYIHTPPSTTTTTTLTTEETKRKPPFPQNQRSEEVPLTWLLQQLQIDAPNTTGTATTTTNNNEPASALLPFSQFCIDQEDPHTKTPVRNLQIQEAMDFFRSLHRWTERITQLVCGAYRKYKIPLIVQRVLVDQVRSAAENIFLPVLPLLVIPNESKHKSETEFSENEFDSEDESEYECVSKEYEYEFEEKDEFEDDLNSSLPSKTCSSNNNNNNNSKGNLSALLSVEDTTKLLHHHARTMQETRDKIQQQDCFASYKNNPMNQLISSNETILLALVAHMGKLSKRFEQTIYCIETMLERQLIAAIGRQQLQTADLEAYTIYHNQKLLMQPPKPFCYSIRQPQRCPNGILSLEQVHRAGSGPVEEPIWTHVRQINETSSHQNHHIEVPLNASTSLELTGNIHLHGWLRQRFGSEPSSVVRLNARARQFSSFCLVVGTMSNGNRLEPKDAILVGNKDEVHIPLLLHEIPTATEFKNSILSLSPEQQRFATSIRSMQLDSSVLGVCVIPIQPQLEKLLGLPPDSLTKEMKLTQDLTELLVEYHIPSDLVSCDCDSDSSQKEKVANVREHVQSVLNYIQGQKQEQLEEEKQKAERLKGEVYIRADGKKIRRIKIPPSEVYTRADGKKVRRIKKSALAAQRTEVSNPDGLYPSNAGKVEVYTRPDGKKVRRIKRSVLAAQKTKSLSGFLADNDSKGANSGSTIVAGDTMAGGSTLQESRKSSADLPKDAAAEIPQDMAMDANEQQDEGDSGHSETEETSSPPASFVEPETMDFVALPKALDRAIESHDASIRSTTIETATAGWTRIRQTNLLSKPHTETLGRAQVASETTRGFSLLDALSKSGSLEIPFSELHVLICATHQFEKSVLETVIQDNINPIESLELSTLLMASTIHGTCSRDLIRSETDLQRLEASLPLLVGASEKYH